MRRMIALVVFLSFNASAAGVGFAQATGYFKKDTRPTLYQPLNLLDARDATAWCADSSDPLNELLTFGFTAPVRIDEIRITNGNNFNESTWGEFARVEKMMFMAGKQRQTFTLEDKREVQSVTFDKPFYGTRLSLEIHQLFAADDPDSPVCITDIVFVSEGKPLNGQWLTTKLKYDKNVQGLMGTWYAGHSGAPDRFLALHFDGTFRYSYEPFDEKRSTPKVIEGKWDVQQGNRISFDIDGKKYAPKFSKDAAKKGGEMLGLDGDLPADLKGPFRSEP